MLIDNYIQNKKKNNIFIKVCKVYKDLLLQDEFN